MMLTTLDSGLRVVSRPMDGVRTAAVGLFASAGSRHETAERNGLAHLFEHMLFKGAGGRSARELSEAIEDVGGDLNAATERDATSFTASVMSEHVPLAVELLSDMILRPHFDPDELEREKAVVLQELAEAESTPSDIIFDELWSAAFADQPLGRSILGSPQTIAAMGVADLEGWRRDHYRSEGLILVAAGQVDHQALVELAKDRLADVAPGPPPKADPASFTGGTRLRRGRSEQAHITFGFAGPCATGQDFLAARLFADIVGGGTSSRLFQSLREERGLVYSVSATLHPHEDVGLFYVHAATARSDAAAASQLVEDILEGAGEGATQRELDRVRTQARAALLMHLETPWGQAYYAARQLAVHGRLIEPEEVLDRLAEVTLEEVRSAGERMLAGPRARATIGVPAVRAA